jgi:hypothetical protein
MAEGKGAVKRTVTPIRENKGGRPSKYNQPLADEICSLLAQGKSVRTVCKAEDMPSMQTVFTWLRTRPEFLEQYTRAKVESADAMAEEVLDIADDDTYDNLEDRDGGLRPNPVKVNRDRLRIETRKWLMAKMKPKKYGDKVDLTSDGKELPTPIVNIFSSNVTKEIEKPYIDVEVSQNPTEIQNGNIMDDIK